MKVIEIPQDAAEIHELLEEARSSDRILRTPDGSEFVLASSDDDFAAEVERTRNNTELMVLLDERRKATESIPLDALKQELGLE